MDINTNHSLRQNYIDSRLYARQIVQFVCDAMLIGAGLLSADDPINAAEEYWNRLGHAGCSACPLVEKCSACMMCE